jgi:hypothetical protein
MSKANHGWRNGIVSTIDAHASQVFAVAITHPKMRTVTTGPVCSAADLAPVFHCFRNGQLEDLEGVGVVAGHHDRMDEPRALPPANPQRLGV